MESIVWTILWQRSGKMLQVSVDTSGNTRCSDCNVGNLETLGLDVEIPQGDIPDWSYTRCHLEVLGLSSFLIGHTPAVPSREEGRGCSIKEGGGEEVLYEEGRRGGGAL